MKKLYSTIMMLAMMVAAFSLTACGGSDDDEENGGGTSGNGSKLELKNLKGTWTTVAVNNVPPSEKEDNFMNFTFHVYWDEGYQYESGSNVGELTLENSAICIYGTPIMDVLSFDGTSLTVKVSKFDGVVFVMKKLGTLNNDDYKNKLVHGTWLHSFDNSDDGVMEYKALLHDETIQKVANLYGNRFQFFQFAKDGTGVYCCGNSGYSFEWELSEKKLTIKTSKGTNMVSNLTLIGIEGFVYLKFERTFNWYGF